MFREITPSAVYMGLLAAFVGYAASFAIVGHAVAVQTQGEREGAARRRSCVVLTITFSIGKKE